MSKSIHRFHKYGSLLLSMTMLSGCMTPGVLPDPAQPVAAEWRHRGALPVAHTVDPTTWWTAFDDAVLNDLVDRALRENLSLAQARHRLSAARALVRPALAQGRPEIKGAATGQRSQRLSGPGNTDLDRSYLGPDGNPVLVKEGRVSGNWQAGFDAAWEIDLFGRVASQVDRARAEVEIADADVRAARVSVVAEMVRSYVELRAAQRRQALLAETLEDQNRLVALVRERRDAGLDADLDVDRSLATAATTASQLQLQAQAIADATQRIAVLTGTTDVDERLLRPEPRQPQASSLSLAVMPADMLRMRPDIRRNEAAVAQASAEVGIAVADLYPRLTLTGTLNATGNLVGSQLPGRTSQLGGGFSIDIPLLDWGARRAVVNAREAALAAAINGYRQAVLEGIQESETALAAIDAQRKRLLEEDVRLQAAQRADAHANALYREGMISLSERLDTTVEVKQAELAKAETLEQEALAVIALHKALGGAGLVPSEARSVPTSETSNR